MGALHGEVKLNGQVLYTWTASRIGDLIFGPDQAYSYLCHVEEGEIGPMDHMEPKIWAFTTRHKYSDNAAVLASKVLARADQMIGLAPDGMTPEQRRSVGNWLRVGLTLGKPAQVGSVY